MEERLRGFRIARRRDRPVDYFCEAQPRVVSLRETAVQKLERMATSAWVAPQNRDASALDLRVVEDLDHLAQTCIVRTPLPVVEGVASLRFGKPHWNLVNQREALSVCDGACQLERGAGGTAE